MNTVLFEDTITIDTVSELIERLPAEVPTDLFFCTEGGSVKDMRALIHHLNKMDEVTVYLNGVVASCGTLLFTECTKDIVVTEDLMSVTFHSIDILTLNLRQTAEEKEIVKACKKDNIKIANKFRDVGLITGKERGKFLKGDDVTLTRDTLIKRKYFKNKEE